ncbi:hypothetical protein ACQPT2_08805 [Erwinia amylovora]
MERKIPARHFCSANECLVSRKKLIEILSTYGFIQCDTLLNFLKYVCDERPDKISCTYIRDITCNCLQEHDNGSHYFENLRWIVKEMNRQLY